MKRRDFIKASMVMSILGAKQQPKCLLTDECGIHTHTHTHTYIYIHTKYTTVYTIYIHTHHVCILYIYNIYIYNGILLSHKKNEIMPFAATRWS